MLSGWQILFICVPRKEYIWLQGARESITCSIFFDNEWENNNAAVLKMGVEKEKEKEKSHPHDPVPFLYIHTHAVGNNYRPQMK